MCLLIVAMTDKQILNFLLNARPRVPVFPTTPSQFALRKNALNLHYDGELTWWLWYPRPIEGNSRSMKLRPHSCTYQVYHHCLNLFLLLLLILNFFADGKRILYYRNTKKTFRDTALSFFFLERKKTTFQVYWNLLQVNFKITF